MKSLLVGIFFLAFASKTHQKNVPVSERKPADARIVGGSVAYPAQYPFMAAITVQTPNRRIFCVGSLISEQWILTAGHCVDGATLFTIQVGSNSLTANDNNRVTVATATYVVHPGFNAETFENDLGLIKLRMPLTLTEYISVTDHLPESDVLDYQNVIAIGWGQTSDSDPSLSDELRWVLMSALPNTECRAVYGDLITDTMVCASGNYNEGPCLGDSGGPLIHVVHAGRVVLMGISSFISSKGCESTDPAGYSRVYPFVEWIRNTTDIWDP